MSWGCYWMFYECPKCGKKFKYTTEDMTLEFFGKCTVCGADGRLVMESRDKPQNEMEYEDGGYRF